MGLWGAVKYALNSSVGASNFEALDVTLGKRADAAGTAGTASLVSRVKALETAVAAVNTAVATIHTNTERGLIKRIQRGVTMLPKQTNVTVTISPIVMEKSIIHLVALFDTEGMSRASCYLLNSTTLEIDSVGYASSNINVRWDIIEFY